MPVRCTSALIIFLCLIHTTVARPTETITYPKTGIPTPEFRAIRIIDSGKVWVSADSGIYYLEDSIWVPINLRHKEKGRMEYSSFVKRSNNLFVTQVGPTFLMLDGDSLNNQLLISGGYLESTITSDSTMFTGRMCGCGNKSIIIAKSKDSTKTGLHGEDNFSTGFTSLFVPHNDTVIVSHWNEGIFILTYSTPQPFLPKPPVRVGGVGRFADRYWITGQRSGMMYLNDDSTWVEIPIMNTYGTISNVYYRNNKAWLHSKEEKSLYEIEDWEKATSAPGESAVNIMNGVVDFDIDSAGNVWVVGFWSVQKLIYDATSVTSPTQKEPEQMLRVMQSNAHLSLPNHNNSKVEVTVRTVSGKLLHSQRYQVKQDKLSLDLSAYAPGAYILSVEGEALSLSQKMLLK